jgi:hypothetical protein
MKTKECKHEWETICNLYGKIIQEFIRGGLVYRSLTRCKHCGQRSMSTEVDKDCKVKNKPNLW